MGVNATGLLGRALGRGLLVVGGTFAITSTGAITVTGATTVKTAVVSASNSSTYTTLGVGFEVATVSAYTGNSVSVTVLNMLTSTVQIESGAKNVDIIVLAI